MSRRKHGKHLRKFRHKDKAEPKVIQGYRWRILLLPGQRLNTLDLMINPDRRIDNFSSQG